MVLAAVTRAVVAMAVAVTSAGAARAAWAACVALYTGGWAAVWVVAARVTEARVAVASMAEVMVAVR